MLKKLAETDARSKGQTDNENKPIKIETNSPSELRIRTAMKFCGKYKAYMDFLRRNRPSFREANELFESAFHKFDGGNVLKKWANMNYPGWQQSYGKFPGKVEEPPAPPVSAPAAAKEPDEAEENGSGAGDELVLVPASVFAGKEQATVAEAVQWALENCIIDGLKPEDAPSATAWLFLVDMRADAKYRKEVVRTWTPRFLTDVENAEARFKDDGESLKGMIGKLKGERCTENSAK